MSRARTVAIPPDVAEVLRLARVDGQRLFLTQATLDRKLYVAVDKVIVAIGGKWQKAAKAHCWPPGIDVAAAMGDALGSGATVDQKKTLEQFWTPPDLAERMAGLACVGSADFVVEPSCGRGNLIAPLLNRRLGEVLAIDIDQGCIEKTHRRMKDAPWKYALYRGDFLDMSEPIRRPDVVLMNPPFSDNQDIAHVRHAWDWLAHGGRLVAITSPHWTFAADKKSVAFRQWATALDAELWTLPAGTFADSGTEISARLLFARRPIPVSQCAGSA